MRKIWRLKEFAGYKNSFWWMDCLYVDEPSKNNKGVKFSLVRQNRCKRKLDAEGLN